MFSFAGPQLSCQNPKAFVVLFHGYGANGANLLPVAEAFNLKDVFFWIPDGHEVCEEYAAGRQWFSLKDFNFEEDQCNNSKNCNLEQCIKKAADEMTNVITNGLGTFSGPIFVGGFSQGAALAYHIGLYNMATNGVIGFSGFFDISSKPIFNPPLFWSHGSSDHVVPISCMKTAKKKLEAYGLTIDSCIIENEDHIISAKGIEKARNFIQKNLT